MLEQSCTVVVGDKLINFHSGEAFGSKLLSCFKCFNVYWFNLILWSMVKSSILKTSPSVDAIIESPAGCGAWRRGAGSDPAQCAEQGGLLEERRLEEEDVGGHGEGPAPRHHQPWPHRVIQSSLGSRRGQNGHSRTYYRSRKELFVLHTCRKRESHPCCSTHRQG